MYPSNKLFQIIKIFTCIPLSTKILVVVFYKMADSLEFFFYSQLKKLLFNQTNWYESLNF